MIFGRDRAYYDRILKFRDYLEKQKGVIKRNEEELKLQEKKKELLLKQQQEILKDVPSQELPRFGYRTPLFKGVLPYWRGWREKFIKGKKERAVLVNMTLRNGKARTFWVAEKKGVFAFKGKEYLFDNESMYEHIDAGGWMYDFHEDISVPIKRVFPVKDIKDSVKMSRLAGDVEYALNPYNLKEALHAQLVEGMIRGAGLAQEFKKLLIIGFITMIASILMIVLFAWKTGMLAQIGNNLPF